VKEFERCFEAIKANPKLMRLEFSKAAHEYQMRQVALLAYSAAIHDMIDKVGEDQNAA
jgi:hypothetical protein